MLTICISCYGCTHNPKPSIVKPLKPGTVSAIKKDSTETSGAIIEPALKKFVDTVNDYLTAYNDVRLFDEYPVKDLIGSKADRDSIIKAAGNTTVIDGLSLADYYRDKIGANLIAILKNKEVLKYKLNDILAGIDIIVSADGRFYNLVMDGQTGGSYKSRISFIHYRAPDGKLYNSTSYGGVENGNTFGDVFFSDGYSSITTLNTKQGIKYLLFGEVIGCNTCSGNYVTLASFKDGTFVNDFSYMLTTRMEGEITYDEKAKKIVVDYTTDDQAPICTCDDSATQQAKEGVDSAGDETPNYGKKCKCVFAFNGSTFIKEANKLTKRKPKV